MVDISLHSIWQTPADWPTHCCLTTRGFPTGEEYPDFCVQYCPFRGFLHTPVDYIIYRSFPSYETCEQFQTRGKTETLIQNMINPCSLICITKKIVLDVMPAGRTYGVSFNCISAYFHQKICFSFNDRCIQIILKVFSKKVLFIFINASSSRHFDSQTSVNQPPDSLLVRFIRMTLAI
jgi:hypothetical protein